MGAQDTATLTATFAPRLTSQGHHQDMQSSHTRSQGYRSQSFCGRLCGMLADRAKTHWKRNGFHSADKGISTRSPQQGRSEEQAVENTKSYSSRLTKQAAAVWSFSITILSHLSFPRYTGATIIVCTQGLISQPSAGPQKKKKTDSLTNTL